MASLPTLRPPLSINAEDAFKNFRPGPGRIVGYLPPGGNYVRMDSHLYPDYLVPPNYDSLLGKLIVWAETREQAITRMIRALNECVISGVPTTIDFHKNIMAHEAFKRGVVDTGFIVQYADDLNVPPPTVANIVAEAAKRAKARAKAKAGRA